MTNHIIKLSLDVLYRAIRLGFIVNIPMALWGPSGCGKSDACKASTPKGWKYYDFRICDKEACDIGGLPMPFETKDKGQIMRKVAHAMTQLLPFDTDEKAVINWEEFDRAMDVSVQNACLQLLLDRQINGHSLSPNARQLICGNGASDSGTLPLTIANARRMAHLYVETKDQAAINSWLNWAKDSECSDMLQSFAKYNADIWTSGEDAGELIDYASPSNRTYVMADSFYRAANSPQVTFETQDILLPCMAGCVGSAAATKMLGWYEVCKSAPTVEEIINNPRNCRLPDHKGVYFVLGLTLARQAKEAQNGKADAMASYVARWPQELAGFAFEYMTKAQPRILTGDPYIKWQASLKQ